LTEGLRQFRKNAELGQDPRNKTGMDPLMPQAWFAIMALEAQTGHLAEARAAQAEAQRAVKQTIKDSHLDAQMAQIAELGAEMSEYEILAAEGNYAKIHALGLEHRARLDQIKSENDTNLQFLEGNKRRNRSNLTESALRLGNYEEAVTSAREAVTNPLAGRSDLLSLKDIKARDQTRLGQALLGAGRRAEALASLDEALVYYRDQQAQGATDVLFRQNFARALYHSARAQTGDEAGVLRRRALLAEAATLLDGLSLEARNLLFIKELIQWVLEAQKAE
jgi:tetratricopeptide (TPR) repeat protein